MSSRPRRGACPTTGKVCYPDRAAAKAHRNRTHMPEVAAFKCRDCGFFHLGGWHGTKDRAAHRGEIPPEAMTVSDACRALDVSEPFMERLIESGKVRSSDGHPFRADIERLLSK